MTDHSSSGTRRRTVTEIAMHDGLALERIGWSDAEHWMRMQAI